MPEQCPKCGEQGPFMWLKTKKGKWWLKRKLDVNQAVKDWHKCVVRDEKKPDDAISICGECGTRCYECNHRDCPLCTIFPCWCKNCQSHPEVVNRQ